MEKSQTVLFYTKGAACYTLQKAVKRPSAVVGIEFDQLSLSFEFIFSLYDLTSSSIETAIRGGEKDDKTSVASCTKCYQDQIQWTGNEIIISRCGSSCN